MTRYKISEIGEVVSGGTPSTKYKEYYSTNKDISWITPKDLSGYTKMYISNGERYITSKGLNNSSAKMLPKDTILISSRAPIGYVAIAQKELATNQGFKSIIPDKTKILPEFLYFTMITKKSELENIATGSTFKEVSGKVMKNFEIDVPTIEKQKQIIDKLIPIVRKIELNNEINTNLLELGLELISNINFKNYLPLNKIVEVKDGTHSSPASTLNGYPLVTSKAIKGTSVDFSQTKNISEADFTEINKRSLVEYHDILISMIGTVGIVHLVTENPVKYAIKNVGLIKSSEKNILSPFLYLYLLSDYGQTYIKEHLSGSTQQFISLTSLRKIPIPISSNIPAKLIEELNAIVLKIEHNSNENNILNSIKNVLLEKYF